MASLDLIDQSCIVVDDRCRNLYYNKYMYRASFRIDYAYKYRYISVSRTLGNLTDQSALVKILIWKKWVESTNADLNIMAGVHHINIYTNDLEHIQKFVEITNVNTTNIIKRVVVGTYEKGVVYHKHPKNKFRLYFNYRRFENSDRTDFVEFLVNNQFYPSQRLKERLKHKQLYVSYTHYVDYDDEQLLTVMALTYHDVIRKVCRIEKG